ncbi:MAG: T9SS type A sorting domain-containing protein [Bacteroidetes bacterium]|nr:T9SS type A sorting domain-containing protein [Bacteroidota bacterium]
MKKNLLHSTAILLTAIIFIPQNFYAQATLISQLDFSGNFSDVYSNATASAFNASVNSFSATTWSWTADASVTGGGVRVTIPDAVFTENDYSIAVTFQFADVSGYRKIIDFFDRGSDQGFYIFSGDLDLYSSGTFGSTVLSPNTDYTVLMTRNMANDSVNAYLFSSSTLFRQSYGVDPTQNYVAKLSGADRVLGFFYDDSITRTEYTSSGIVDQIRIWNGIVNLNDVMTGTISENALPSFNIYPVPAEHSINISFPMEESGLLEIFDVTGNLVKSESMEGKENFSMNIDGLDPGMYLVRINGICRRFIKE